MIDEREAIYILKNTAWLGSNDDREKTEEAVRMAVEALEKQIPKKPLKEYHANVYQRTVCANCENIFGLKKEYKYCPECGQRIDGTMKEDSDECIK